MFRSFKEANSGCAKCLILLRGTLRSVKELILHNAANHKVWLLGDHRWQAGQIVCQVGLRVVVFPLRLPHSEVVRAKDCSGCLWLCVMQFCSPDSLDAYPYPQAEQAKCLSVAVKGLGLMFCLRGSASFLLEP